MKLEYKVEIGEISLAGDHGKLRLVATISREDFDDTVPGSLGKAARQQWIDCHADVLGALMVKKYECGESTKTLVQGSSIERIIINRADLQTL